MRRQKEIAFCRRSPVFAAVITPRRISGDEDISIARDSAHFTPMSFDRSAPREDALSDARCGTGDSRPGSFAREKFGWLDQVRADAELTPLAFMLAYVLANLVNEREGYAWPSVARLASECRVTERAVQKVIQRLMERGHLRVEKGLGRGQTNHYHWRIQTSLMSGAHCPIPETSNQPRFSSDLEVPTLSQPAPIKRRMEVHPSPVERVNHSSQKDEPPFQKGRTTVHPTLFKESIYDPIYRLSKQRNVLSAPAGFEDFWLVYPKQVARTDAVRAFAHAVRDTPANEIIRGAMRYADERRGEDPRFTKHPATWLSKGCWSDPLSSPHALTRDDLTLRGRFDGSLAARMHSDDDFDEVSARIQQQRNRGKK